MSNRSIFGDKAVSGPINRDAAWVSSRKKNNPESPPKLRHYCKRCGKDFSLKIELDTHLQSYHARSSDIIETL
jgi:hypothetical protein